MTPRRFLLGALAALSVPATWDYVHFMARERTPVLELPFSWVFLPYGLLVIALMGVVMYGITVLMEQRFTGWATRGQEGAGG